MVLLIVLERLSRTNWCPIPKPFAWLQAAARPAAAEANPSMLYVITFFRNNIFTVNEGPPRSTLDPANRSFIESISRVGATAA